MHDIGFVGQLAVVMMVAGVTTLVFHRLRQPVLLGYILAGILIGPHTPGVLVDDPETISDISNLGVVLLMFTLGLEFSVRKLRALGAGVLLATLIEVSVMLLLGYQVSQWLGMDKMDSLFMGAIVALSSTMVASRTLAAKGLQARPFAHTVLGMLVAEDVFTIVIITLLTAVAIGGTVKADMAFTLIGHLIIFVVVGMVLGLLLLPRLVDHVASYQSNEILLIIALAICFGISLLAVKLGFSVALGAFMAGVMVAESRNGARVVHLVEPLRDMFSALFFVSIGLRIDPSLLLYYLAPALVVVVLVVVGKTLLVSGGLFLVGHDARTSLRTGLSMAQIGEFSFVIATLGSTLDATSEMVYPVAVAVSLICMAASPYLVNSADDIINGVHRLTPTALRHRARRYSNWLNGLVAAGDQGELAPLLRRFLWYTLINGALVLALFAVGGYINARSWRWFSDVGIYREVRHNIIWAAAFFLSLPMLIAICRQAEALGVALVASVWSDESDKRRQRILRVMLAQLVPLVTLVCLALLVGELVSVIQPSGATLLWLLVIGIAVALVLWRALIKVHGGLQSMLTDTLYRPEDETKERGKPHQRK